MSDYKQVIKEAELALTKGAYINCIKLIKLKIKDYPISSNPGVELRIILITALSGLNKDEEALIICKELLKSTNLNVRENAKSLIGIISSPELGTPDNWNIKFENILENKHSELKSINRKEITNKEERFINIFNKPTGETRPFQKGFILFVLVILISLMTLLSGCVRINNTIDMRDIDSISLDLEIESKYIKKLPWQINFENQLKRSFPQTKVTENDINFSLKEKGLNLMKTNIELNKILKIA